MKKVDEIYVGARKRSKAGKFLLGSTTQYVVLHAPCPVVTVK
jgi:nucleotide-binding universal stress UspA family protein